MRKAMELAVMCNAQVALVMFDDKGKLSQFSTNDMDIILEQYGKAVLEPHERYTPHDVSSLAATAENRKLVCHHAIYTLIVSVVGSILEGITLLILVLALFYSVSYPLLVPRSPLPPGSQLLYGSVYANGFGVGPMAHAASLVRAAQVNAVA